MPAKKTITPEQAAKKEAEKVARFKDLANKRVPKALGAIAAIGGLASKSSYSYTPEQVQVLENALNAEVQKTLQRFRGGVATATLFQ